jgi:hypothetical protein
LFSCDFYFMAGDPLRTLIDSFTYLQNNSILTLILQYKDQHYLSILPHFHSLLIIDSFSISVHCHSPLKLGNFQFHHSAIPRMVYQFQVPHKQTYSQLLIWLIV